MQRHYRTRGEARPRHEPAPAHAGEECPGPVDGTPARLFLCQRCRVQVLICSRCDRGHVYCAAGCAQAARRGSQRDAGRRYQASRRGRVNHAVRARRYRSRKNIVTHQGSPPDRPDDLLCAGPVVAVTEPSPRDNTRWPRWHCHGCGRRCPELVRRDFLRRGRDPWNHRRGPDP